MTVLTHLLMLAAGLAIGGAIAAIAKTRAGQHARTETNHARDLAEQVHTWIEEDTRDDR